MWKGLLILCRVCKCSTIKGEKKPEDYSKNLTLSMLSQTHGKGYTLVLCPPLVTISLFQSPLTSITSREYLGSGSKQTFYHASFNHPISWSENNPVWIKLGVKRQNRLWKVNIHLTWATKNSQWPGLQESLLPTDTFLTERGEKILGRSCCMRNILKENSNDKTAARGTAHSLKSWEIKKSI